MRARCACGVPSRPSYRDPPSHIGRPPLVPAIAQDIEVAHPDPRTAAHSFDAPVTSEDVGIPAALDELLGFGGGRSARGARFADPSGGGAGVSWPAPLAPLDLRLEPRPLPRGRRAGGRAPAVAAPPLAASNSSGDGWAAALGIDTPDGAAAGAARPALESAPAAASAQRITAAHRESDAAGTQAAGAVGGYADPLFSGDAAADLLASLGL